MLGYRALRRKAASLLNGYAMPRLGVKLVPVKPKTMRFERLSTANGRSRVLVGNGSRQVEVEIREGGSDWMTFDQVFVDEDYDLRPLARFGEVRGLYQSMLAHERIPLIVDLGANAGYSSLYFHLTWPEARVAAVEPDPDNFALLTRNVGACGSVDPLHAAAASKAGTLRIADPRAGKNAIRTSPDGTGVEVEAVTMDGIVERYRAQGCEPFIAKLDIEGAEGELFSANIGWIDQFPLIAIELHDWLYPGEGTARNFLKAMAERDRDFVYLDENVFSIRNPLGQA
ncbi:MAG TPA: FkbM family methyltransferase [Sphingomicrobium sp.]|nr:FkbM family methyltransferase [Sphingomicrobium sp.]